MRHASPQTSPPQRPSVASGHVGGSPGLVDEDQPFGIEIELALKPGLAPLADIRPVLLGGMRGLFLRVIVCRRQKRQSALTLTWAPCWAKRAFNSGRVMSGTSAKAAWIRSAWASVRPESRSRPAAWAGHPPPPGRSPPRGGGGAPPPPPAPPPAGGGAAPPPPPSGAPPGGGDRPGVGGAKNRRERA